MYKFHKGQIVKIYIDMQPYTWYTSDFLRVLEVDDKFVIVSNYHNQWEDGRILFIYLYDATEEYRQETIKRLLCSE